MADAHNAIYYMKLRFFAYAVAGVIAAASIAVLPAGRCSDAIGTVQVSPAELPEIVHGIRVENHLDRKRDYLWFSIIFPDTSFDAERIAGSVQVGGVPGEAASADVWCDLERHEGGYTGGMRRELLAESFLILRVGEDSYALNLWDFFEEYSGAE